MDPVTCLQDLGIPVLEYSSTAMSWIYHNANREFPQASLPATIATPPWWNSSDAGRFDSLAGGPLSKYWRHSRATAVRRPGCSFVAPPSTAAASP